MNHFIDTQHRNVAAAPSAGRRVFNRVGPKVILAVAVSLLLVTVGMALAAFPDYWSEVATAAAAG